MLVFPAPTAVTTPVFELTEATNRALLPHEPPGVPLLVKVGVAPIQSDLGPEIVPAVTFGLTTIGIVAGSGALQPVTV